MLWRFSRYLRRCWWRYGGHYVSDMTTVASTAFDVDVCRLKSRSMTMKNNNEAGPRTRGLLADIAAP